MSKRKVIRRVTSQGVEIDLGPTKLLRRLKDSTSICDPLPLESSQEGNDDLMADEFIRKDVFDLAINGLRQEFRADINEMRVDIANRFGETNVKIESVNSKIESLNSQIKVWGIVLGAILTIGMTVLGAYLGSVFQGIPKG